MRAVKGKGNKSTEGRLRAILARAGIGGWKTHVGGVPGKPDFFFPAEQVALFADGCFWHGCPRCGHVPNSNRPFWEAKIRSNQRRDLEKARKLEEAGIRVLRVWEHDLKPGEDRAFLQTLKVMLGRANSGAEGRGRQSRKA
jgi:DNA mismatch endonuclease (patch repair protein)